MNRTAYLILFYGLLLYSCGDNAGGNKSSFSTKESKSGVYDDKGNEITKEGEQPKVSDIKYTFQFTSFKTPKKVGVNGTFTDIKLTATHLSDSLEVALKGAKFIINTNSISTNDIVRDATIKANFFEKLVSQEISGSFDNFEKDKAKITLTINDKTKTFDFKYTINNDGLVLSGTVDVISDFAGNEALKSLTKACVPHEGKTWSDVNFIITFKK